MSHTYYRHHHNTNAAIIQYKIHPLDSRQTLKSGDRTYKNKRGNVTIEIINSNIVPYNTLLSLRYNAHVNVEVVNSDQAVKYL